MYCKSKHHYSPKLQSMKSLLTICVEFIMSHIDLYANNFPLLPIHIKNRILKRLTSIKVNYKNISNLLKMLIHSQLKQIDFSLIEVDDDLLKTISICSDLREIILSRHENNLFSEIALIDVMSNFNKLIIFQSQNCIAISDNVIEIVVKNCPNLSELDIAGCINITDLSLFHISKLSKLTALNISRTKITNKGLKSLVDGSSGPNIKELRIADCQNVNHIAINFICENCTSLEVLISNNCAAESGQTNVNFDNANLKKLKQLTWTVY